MIVFALAFPGRAAADPDELLEVEVQGERAAPSDRGASPGRASSTVTRRELEEQLPRSAPDALRYEPGVFVQQTAHGQGSPFVRGRTGQQLVILFDGIRLNTSTYRQGPNQYFFTLDAGSIERIEVVRGGASTRYGSDAIGGALLASPLEPPLVLGAERPVLRPRASVRASSADGAYGYRAQLGAQVTSRLRAIVGGGGRRVGLLEGGGAVRSPKTGEVPFVPSLLPDGRTQRGTGFREITGDARLVFTPSKSGKRKLTAAAYAYRQYDAPRTDQCPPPEAPLGDCLRYDEQFRTLAYLKYAGEAGPLGRALEASASFQRQHERRTRDRPASFVRTTGRDDVDTFGLAARVEGRPFALGERASLDVAYGLDAYLDRVDSAAFTEFTDLATVVELSRGQYLAASSYLQGGAFAEATSRLGRRVVLRAGGRLAGAFAEAPGDPSTESAAVSRGFGAAVGHAGLEVKVARPLSLLANLDRSFRAPNLDDLTSRQQTGPGFQIENPDLLPEAATTLEAGLRVELDKRRLELDAWVFRSVVSDAIARAVRSSSACPPGTAGCAAARSRVQLVNLDGSSTVDGFEVSARAAPAPGLSARGSVSYAFGEGPNPQPRPAGGRTPYEARVPLSRVPPLHGSAEARFEPAALARGSYASEADEGAYLGLALRWALAQNRLAPSDATDARIPLGGTPGFAVFDARVGYRMRPHLVASVVFENLGDAAYRYHGSSVNGPGRGFVLQVEGGL